MHGVTTKQGIGGMAASRPEEDIRRSVSASVRAARALLTSVGPLRPDYKFELMQLYARNQLGAALGLPLLAVIVAGMMALWVPIQTSVQWLIAVLIAKFIILALCRTLLQQPPEEVNVRDWQARFVAAELLYGASWASLSFMSAHTPGSDPAPHVVIFAALIVILSLRTMLAGSLTPITYAGTVPIALVLLIGFVLLGEPMYYALAGITVCAQIYFFLVARHLTADTLAMFDLRVQKDSLIAELEQANSISDEARRRAEAANIAKSRFLATMSHELRTPLNAVLGFSEVMKAEILGPHNVPTYKEYSQDIHRSGQHLLKLINEVLDLSRIEAGRYELHEEPISLAGVADDCMRLTELRMSERGITLSGQLEKDMPKLLADERAVRQICLNLLSNSIKFTPNGGQIIVKVGWTEGGGQYLSVIDTGPGISEEELPQILTSFGQGSLAQKTAEQGAGLGLPIVQGLIKLHGGKFQIASKLREGTQVTVTFPRTRILTAQPVGALANSAA
ncbi:MAG: HAMP domain-containing sensor histidine kinase [Hyphomicrobiales bacterium]|nr:HAMP domain-containing sensor histidine kinase [Hyphomicrobiales bacterium]